jgi:hypothetical protein
MGMVGNYLRVSKEEFEEYMQESSKLEDRVYSEDNLEDKNLMDVDKAWEGIFFLLTGASLSNIEDAKEPLSLILNATELDPEQDMGYGPALYNTVEQVKAISAEMNKISEEDLKKKFHPEKMMELQIYPNVWDRGEEELEYLIDYYDILKEFYNTAAKEQQAVVFFIS